MCLACTTPVRGKTFGAECLSTALGAEVAPIPETPRAVPRSAARRLALVAFGLAALATTVPWSRFGPGSGPLGAWIRAPRWSVVAAIAAVLGLALALAQRNTRVRTPAWDTALASLGALVAVASLLDLMFPPAFSHPWLGPWVAVWLGALACGASVVARIGTREPRGAHV